MNYIVTVVNPQGLDILLNIYDALQLPLSMVMYGRGTATQNVMDLLGIESKDRRIVITVADKKKTDQLIREQRRKLYIDVPGNGVTVTVPIKSIGGRETLAYLSNGKSPKGTPDLNYQYELVVAIANEGHADEVMDAARAAGATGGTIFHGKGAGSKKTGKFYNISIAQEKEMVMIVAKAADKAKIMSAILESTGPDTKAGAIVFSLPVGQVAGFSLLDDEEESE